MSQANASIPFNRPTLMGDEGHWIAEAIAYGQLSGDGLFSRRCAAILSEAVGSVAVMLTPSCTHGLELAALALRVGPGDEVIVPSFTFVSTANAFALYGAKIRFADIDPLTLNICPASVEALMNERTKVVVPVHYAGIGCDMEALSLACQPHGAALVEDNAHGLFSTRGGRPLGSQGMLSTTSFHETKNLSCGEGGALFINDGALLARIEVLRQKGTNRNAFLRGEIDKYTWVDIGSSWLMGDLLAAVLYAQLIARERILASRRRVWERYWNGLSGWASEHGVRLPHVPSDCAQAYHMFYLLLPSLTDRESLRSHLASCGVMAVFHYVPLHGSPMGLHFDARPEDCPVANRTSDGLLRLPFYTSLADADIDRVIEGVRSWEGPR